VRTLGKTKTVTIICWVISALALLGLVIWFLIGGVFGFGFDINMGLGTFEPAGTYQVSVDEVDSLSIDWTSGAIYIGTHGGSDIQITEFSQRRLRDGDELYLNTDGGTLSIYFTEDMRRGSSRFRNTPTKRLEVLIPHGLAGDFDRFHVDTVSGRVEVRGITAEDFVISTVSGRIELTDITAPTVRASTTSGRIELLAVQGEEIRLHTISGRIVTRDTVADHLDTNTTSGRHELSGTFGYVNVWSTSGRIEVTSTIVPERLTARASSGRIGVTIPNTGTVSVQQSTTSGRFTSEIPVTTHGGADAQLTLSTTSGRITISELR